MKEIKIIKNRSDIGAGTRGSDMGIDAIEIAAINKGSNYFDRYDFEDVITENESIYNKENNSFGKRIENVFNQCKRLSNHVKVNLQEGKFPVVISGDHSSALGTISGVKAANPTERVGVIWIDDKRIVCCRTWVFIATNGCQSIGDFTGRSRKRIAAIESCRRR